MAFGKLTLALFLVCRAGARIVDATYNETAALEAANFATAAYCNI